jgi:acyl-homoserine lactone acylase PvdQ
VLRRLLSGVVALLLLALAAPGLASAQVEPYGANDYGDFNNILPPGQSGFDNLVQLGEFEANKTYPPHSNDQLQMYENLTTAAPNIQESQIGDYYKDATFGVPAGDVGSTESPEPGVTIVRDTGFGVPHIYGDTRAELMFGIGYATAEDRLFFIDALRHAGDGTLASFAGGSNAAMDESVWADEPYTSQDFQNQLSWAQTNLPDGSTIYSDVQNYVDGINAYITTAESPLNTLTMLPGEYAAIGQPQGPQPFTMADMIRIATLVGGIFGVGGGEQLQNAILYENLERKFGSERTALRGLPTVPPKTKRKHAAKPRAKTPAPAFTASAKKKKHGARAHDKSGFATFLSFDQPSDPEAPTTVHGRSFPYQTLPKPSKAVAKTVALPDPGSVQFVNPLVSGALPSSSAPALRSARSATVDGDPMFGSDGPLLGAPDPSTGTGTPATGLLAFPRSMSNALLVSAKDSASGHPLMVAGPQVSYFSPEILMEEDIHGPGVDAEGAAFPGVNMYVELGHGRDYAWSATSSGQNIVDTFAVPLCNPSGGAVSFGSDDYVLDGQCVAMQILTDQESWTPNLADQTPAGSATFQTLRTAYGLVIARARIDGRPVVYCNLRSTYMHELDSAVGFLLLNEPAAIQRPQDFFNAADHIGYTFNWFYADPSHIAYFDSGLNPVRAPHTDPLFPSWASYSWEGFQPAAAMTPASLTEEDTSESAHPHVTDQPYLTSWNNKQAPGYNDAATGQEYASVYRSQLLDNNLNNYLAVDHGKLTLADVINAMGNAGTQDLRGVEVLPYALRIIGHPSNPALANAVSELSAWVASGAHRINRERPGASGDYDQTDAVRIMDAWWPLLVNAEFGPILGSSILGEIGTEFPINDEPGHGTTCCHVGSSFDVGFYGVVQKDLRSVLGEKVTGPLNRVYCGNGSLAGCRAALESSLLQAVDESPQQVYPADSVCAAGDQMCSDSIQFRAVGAIKQPLIEWINRPTFQQADDLTGVAGGG